MTLYLVHNFFLWHKSFGRNYLTDTGDDDMLWIFSRVFYPKKYSLFDRFQKVIPKFPLYTVDAQSTKFYRQVASFTVDTTMTFVWNATWTIIHIRDEANPVIVEKLVSYTLAAL